MKAVKEKISVAIQGVRGSFHEIAAIEYFMDKEVEAVPCDTFGDLFHALEAGTADYGIVAFENSVAGSILPNYELLRRSHLPVTGEICLRVKQNLVAMPGQQISDIREIHSHPMAIQQCSMFINEMRQRGVRIIEAIDTALSARIISEDRQYGSGAIASSNAAEIYSLEVLRQEIEDDSLNFTRFLIVSGNRSKASESGSRNMADDNGNGSMTADGGSGEAGNRQEGTDKAMVCFSLPHKVGSLSQVLSVLAFYQVSLTKIQSLPIVGRPWEYLFHIDLIYNDFNRYRMALEAIRPLTEGLEIVGEYRRGLMPFESGSN
ncbi:MAG: prephenate dehydratase [Bacteroidales bacterium]|jgi:prephenate dehydratase|nr:prephenate dehydratase [Bacteroidales bacterium]